MPNETMERGSLKCIYVFVCNLLLLSLMLDAVREGAYQAGSIRYGWFSTGIFALALFILVIHLAAVIVALLVSGMHRAAGAIAPTLRSKPRLHLLERGLLLAFLYINLLYFDILVTDFQIQLVGYTSAYSNVKQIVYLVLIAACVVFISPARIQGFIRNNSSFLRMSATISLVAAVVLLGGRFGYGLYNNTKDVEAAHRGGRSLEAASVVEERPNIILLTFDELSAAHMSLYGYERKTTPYLEEMAESSVVFERAYSSTNWTAGSLPSFVLGTYPTTHKFRMNGFIRRQDERQNLIRLLESSGYSIRLYGYFFSDKPRGANGDYIEPLPGMQVKVYYQQERALSIFGQVTNKAEHLLRKLDREVILVGRAWSKNISDLHSTMWRRISNRPAYVAGLALARLGVERGTGGEYMSGAAGEAGGGELEARLERDFGLSVLRRTLGEMKGPMFLWFHSRPPHSPYDPPLPYLGHFLESRETFDWLYARLERNPSDSAVHSKLVSRYDEFIRYMDSGLARMMEVLEETGALERSVVIISSDHGLRNLNQNRRGMLTEEEIRIPLIVRLPDGARGLRDKQPAGTVDIAPTILDLLGIPAPLKMDGESLVARLQGMEKESLSPRYVFSGERRRVAIIEGQEKKVFNMDSGSVSSCELPDCGDENTPAVDVDADETQNIRKQVTMRFGPSLQW